MHKLRKKEEERFTDEAKPCTDKDFEDADVCFHVRGLWLKCSVECWAVEKEDIIAGDVEGQYVIGAGLIRNE